MSTSGYYAWVARPPSKREIADGVLTAQILDAFDSNQKVYGAPRIHAELADADVHVGRKRIARLMRQAGIVGCHRRKHKLGTTRQNPNVTAAPDLVDRKFTATAPNQLSLADVTYVPTVQGWLYLACATDVFSRMKAVGARWFRQGGGMPPFDLKPLSGRYLSFREREEIALMKAQGAGVRRMARELGRDPSTSSRELRRNAATRGGKLDYRASVAQWKADLVARRPKTAKLVANQELRQYVQERLSGQVDRLDGAPVAGPAAEPWTGRNKPHRKDREWVRAWSPEQIANRIKVDFPDDESMRISHEAIYQALYIQGRGALKRELILCLRTGRALRAPRARSRRKTWAHVTPEALISERPAEAEDRAVPGHWEGDLLIGLERSAIGTVVERNTRFSGCWSTYPAKRATTTSTRPRTDLRLAGYGAITMKNALANTMTTLPELQARSITWDRGKEMSAHAAFKVENGIPLFFADPQSPWQRRTNENTVSVERGSVGLESVRLVLAARGDSREY